ncbi:hypothetical protein L861_17295 [Litchfieldella anticariensis FP35 = DSM 16096]|uniref:Uncharacterized protein n=2 Tax=Litchfieldella anticariensis TaxID=258591 RepID=S2KS14_LITA3|nr:hypothetical protein L861_17295 [Halomonas anticariensis FP35 = DSM 16096]
MEEVDGHGGSMKIMLVTVVVAMMLSLPAVAQENTVAPDETKHFVAELQQSLGNDPEDLARFVQMEISLEPYRAVLRGARGTLRAQAGNLHDRAVLLAELLTFAGYETRIVEADASDAAQEELSKLVRSEDTMDVRESSETVQSLLADTTHNLIRVGDALFESGFRPEENPHEFALSGAFETYVWVQFREDEGQWRALETIPASLLDELTEDATPVSGDREKPAHTVTFTLIATLQRGDIRREKTLLEHTVDSQWLLLPSGFFHVIDEGGVRGRLTLGPLSLSSDPLPAPADLEEETGEGLFGSASQLEGVTDLFGSLPSGTPSTSEEDNAHHVPDERIIREILRVEFSGPGYDRSVDYTLFDLAGEAEQASEDDYRAMLRLNLGAIHGLTLFTGNVSHDMVTEQVAAVGEPDTAKGITEILNLYNLSYLQLRQSLPVSIVDAPLIRVPDAPNLMISRVKELDADGHMEIDVDLTHRRYSIVPSGGYAASEGDLFYEAVFNGILDQVVERAVFSRPGRDAGAASFFEVAAKRDIELVTLREPDDSPPRYIAGSEFDTYMRSAREAGKIIVLPTTLPENWREAVPAWWEIDSSSGSTIDVNSLWLHMASTDHAIQVHERATWAERVKSLGCVVAVVAGSTTVQVGEAISITDPVSGQPLTVIGSGVEQLGKLMCKRGASVPPSPQGIGSRTPSQGFRAIHRVFLNKPWRPNGPRFPRPG